MGVGSHQLVVRDSAGAESLTQSVTVPGPLTVGQESFTDDADTMSYRVSFGISGGTPPYEANVGTVTDGKYTSGPVPSEQSIEVEITDSVGCTASKEFTHKVTPPCNLPCDGQSRWSAYRLWLQPPIDNAAYKGYKPQNQPIVFRFNGEELELPEASKILGIPNSELNNDFTGAIGTAIKRLNEAVNKALIAKFGQLGKNRLVFSYKPAVSDPYAVLWIEYFVCETFNLEFDFTFAKPSPTFSLTMRYTKEPTVAGASFDGAVVINKKQDNKETRVPAFGSSERNQCTGSEYKKL